MNTYLYSADRVQIWMFILIAKLQSLMMHHHGYINGLVIMGSDMFLAKCFVYWLDWKLVLPSKCFV